MTDVAKQSLMAVGSGLLKSKGLDSSATPGQVIKTPELSNDLKGDKDALREFNNALQNGLTPAEAYADHLTNVSKAAQEAARQSNGLPVDIDKYANAQTAASMATKVSTGSMIAQSVASTALSGAISMGVTLAVNGLITGLDYLAHAHERAVEAVDNANQAYAENETKLNSASSSLAQVEERLNALNSIEHKSLAEEAETAELEQQREQLADQVALLQTKEKLLSQQRETAAKELMYSMGESQLINNYDLRTGKQAWYKTLFNGVSAEDFSDFWINNVSTKDIDLSAGAYDNVRESLIGIAEEYQKIADSSDGAIGDKARKKVEQIAFALGDADSRAEQFSARLAGDDLNDARDRLVDAALAGELTADSLRKIAGDDLARQLNNVSGSAEATTSQLIAMAQSGQLAKSATDGLKEANASLCSTSQKISEIESAVNASRSLSASQVSELCSKYPQLSNYITKTSDGYRVQKEALSLLSGITNNVSKGYIQCQIDMTKAAIEGAQIRLKAINSEASSFPLVAPSGNMISTTTRIELGMNRVFPSSKVSKYTPLETLNIDAQSKKAKEARNEISSYQKELKALESLLNNHSVYQTDSSSGYSYQNTALDNELKRIEHLKAIGKYEKNELGYINALKNARAHLTKKTEERWQLDEKIYAAEEAYNKKKLDDYLDEISYKEAMGKYDDNQAQKIADLTYAYNHLAKKKEDLRNLEKQIHQETEAYQKAEADKAKDAADAIENIVDMRMKYIRKEQELKKKALEDELDGYQKLYDAQSKALDKQKEADDYAKTAAKKRKAIADIETRLNELSADTSAASQREQAELRAELAEKQEELEEYENEQSIQKQKEKLDEEYALLEEQNNAKIEKIDEFLDNEGAVRDAAMADIMTRSNTVYTELLEWNKKYGDGIDKTVTDAWKAATEALQQYGSQANALKIAENPDDIKVPVKTPSASVQQKPASGGSSSASANKAPVKGGRVSVTVKDAAAYASSTGKRVGSWSTMAKNAGVGWNQKLYVTNIANGKVAIGTTAKIGNTIAWVDKKNVKGYRTGSSFIPYDQLALVDEAGPELIIRNPVRGRLTHLSRGDGVLNSTLTERIMALAGNPTAFLSQSMAKLTSAFRTGMSTGAAPSIQIDSKVIVEGNADRETVKALEKAENRIAEKVFSQANKKYLRSGHTINPKHLG